MLLAGLSAGHKIALGVVALVFIGFALTSSFVAPRRRPDFPGKNGLSVFIIACFFMFAAMLSAVVVFGVESEAKGAGAEATTSGATVQVQEKEYKITLATTRVHHGVVTFVVKNVGKIPHDLTIQGGKHTASIGPGKTAKLTATLKKGAYTLYCSVPGHRQLGMVTKLTVT
ncbi:MAG TPA: cupredoxin domain-containing protein [Gaiellaceae bacterium]|nr:cupredoxin domain-containing protein [Gaiellaceae bacterium]